MAKKQPHEKAPRKDVRTAKGTFAKGYASVRSDGLPPSNIRCASHDALVEMVMSLLAMRKKKWEIRRDVEAVIHGKLNHSQVDNLINLAQRRMVENFRQDREIHLGNAQAFYEEAIREAPEWRDKLAAQAGISALHGLNFDPNKNKTKSDDERADEYKRIIEELQKSTANDTESIADDDEEA